jgi:hypothetical protein
MILQVGEVVHVTGASRIVSAAMAFRIGLACQYPKLRNVLKSEVMVPTNVRPLHCPMLGRPRGGFI